ncbi:MAG: hypothetical protein QM656_13040 [Paracoccaceae bacterium]
MQEAPATAWIARARSIKADTQQVVTAALRSAGARRVLIFGGEGQHLAAGLRAAGFEGVEWDALASPSCRGRDAEGDDFPGVAAQAGRCGDGGHDAAVLVDALRMVPPNAMETTLTRVLDILRPGASLLVVEPLPAGSFFRAMRPVGDEGAIRLQAMAAVERLITSGRAELRELQRWDRETRFRGLEDFVAFLLLHDPARAGAIRDNASALARAWRANIQFRGGVAILIQPLICWTLAARRPAE